MMRLIWALLPGLTLSAAGVAAPVPRTIPARFAGDWASSLDRCRPGKFDDANLRITPNSFEDQNGRVKVRRVAITGPDSLQATGRLKGLDYEPSVSLALADEGRTLVVGAEEDTSHYVRCPK